MGREPIQCDVILDGKTRKFTFSQFEDYGEARKFAEELRDVLQAEVLGKKKIHG